MPNPVNLFQIVAPQLPIGYCPNPQTWQQVADDFFGGAQITALVTTGNYQYNYGPTTPSVNQRIFPWLNTSDGNWYTFQFGLWVTPHPVPAGGQLISWWPGAENGSLAGLWSYDGGDGADPRATVGGSPNPAYVAPTRTTGAMWMVYHQMDGRFPIAPGTLPSTTVIGVTNTGGEENHALIEAEGAPHSHLIAKNVGVSGGPVNADVSLAVSRTDQYSLEGVNAVPDVFKTDLGTGTGDGHNNMPPYYGLYPIIRTARVWKTLPG